MQVQTAKLVQEIGMQACSPSSPAGPRLWRPAAQRSLRNSWSSISMHLSAWSASSSLGFSAASSLVNTLLSSRYLEFMDFGVLKAMNDIWSKAHDKLFYQGEVSFMEMLSSYKSLVEILSIMQKAQGTMRTYLKGPVTRHLVEFSDQQHLDKDAGDGDGLAVFSTLSVYCHEMLAQELLDMFIAEIKIKWLVISEFHFLLYSGVDDYHPKKVDSKKLMDKVHAEAASKLPGIFCARLEREGVVSTQRRPGCIVKREILQVYLTAWLAEVNIRKKRKDEILKVISEEMQGLRGENLNSPTEVACS